MTPRSLLARTNVKLSYRHHCTYWSKKYSINYNFYFFHFCLSGLCRRFSPSTLRTFRRLFFWLFFGYLNFICSFVIEINFSVVAVFSDVKTT